MRGGFGLRIYPITPTLSPKGARGLKDGANCGQREFMEGTPNKYLTLCFQSLSFGKQHEPY